ncbi:DUF2599 domain-containing protein [Mycolicibacter terrae]|uniref:DUF2599 domain-containing protein n=2 Tax=Mycolicibacter TaxID=1073531 RepID=A0A1A2NPU6_MYCSD|nr:MULTISPECIES: DUF2599 domain-containing protein [Mycolicibacter]OBH17112.1 hypothetical protein A5694_04755 [Mycolicibacter sinensis]OBI24967.1 hypothetical protein A5710_10360 [Mycolicibacter sinensis]RRR41474.1 DUF2599 domain-containing protein [Mycolicibacter terrae]
MARSTISAVGIVAAVLVPAAPVWADAGSPGLVDHTEWVGYGDLSSLRVYPTPAGRAAAARVDGAAEGEQAWREVLAGAPEADTPSMRDQFLCHWNYAEFARPGKTSWNLEPWRPVVDGVTMLESGCNPGAAEEAF